MLELIISLILSGLSTPTNIDAKVGERLDPNAALTLEQIEANPMATSVYKGCAKGMSAYAVGESDDGLQASADPVIAHDLATNIGKYCTQFVTKFRNAGNMAHTQNPEKDGCRDGVIAFMRSQRIQIYQWNPKADLYCDVKPDPKQTVAAIQKIGP
jgi:hypothetical protein